MLAQYGMERTRFVWLGLMLVMTLVTGCDKLGSDVEAAGGGYEASSGAVSLDGPTITDDTISFLRRHDSVRLLSLQNTKMTTEGLDHLTNLDQLVTLDLSGSTQVGPGAGAKLKELTSLRTLALTDTSITDEDAMQLLDLPELRTVGVEGTGVSQDTADRLRKTGLRVGGPEGSKGQKNP